MAGARRLVAGAVALVAVVAWGVPGAAAIAQTTITSCDETTFRNAVAAGGTVQFGVDCPNLVLTSELAIPSGLQVDIQANGHTVALNGGNAVRHFHVTGGTLSITGMTLKNGRAGGSA